jgi:hypothetical protein
MGMFDDIKCEYPLPLPETPGELAGRNWRDNVFQTKDFDCLMDAYCIREDGTLWQQTYIWETTRKGRPCRKPADWQPRVSHTGAVYFYNLINGNQADYWVEWVAVFISGKVSELKLERWEQNDNRARLASEARWKSEADERDRFLGTWMGRHVYPSYSWVVHGCFGHTTYHLWQWIGSRCQIIGLGLNRLGNTLAPYGDPIRAEKRRREWNDWFDDEDDSDER